VIRSYHGHLSGVYALALHPELPFLVTGGRDSAVRLWDIRTRLQVHCLSGHSSTIASLLTHAADPQVISGSHDKQIRLWDIRKGSTMHTLTYHKKSVRAMGMSPHEVRRAARHRARPMKRIALGHVYSNTAPAFASVVQCHSFASSSFYIKGRLVSSTLAVYC
jgi:pleiotropic regulator 1